MTVTLIVVVGVTLAEDESAVVESVDVDVSVAMAVEVITTNAGAEVVVGMDVFVDVMFV